MTKISAIVLTRNEEDFLPGCLKSLRWVDEIVVVDAGSLDATLTIADAIHAKVIKAPWEGFPKQRNLGAKYASGDWLLYVDADERVSKELREEINKGIEKNTLSHASYKIPHKNIILGQWLKYGGWYPEYQHRLLKKDALVRWEGELHEHPRVTGTVGFLKGNLIHLTHRGLGWMLEKTIRYTRLEAELRRTAGHPAIAVKHLFSAPAREFWFRCVKKSGWRDGLIGWIEIFYQAFNQFLIMVWLWEMQRNESLEKTYKDIDAELINEL